MLNKIHLRRRLLPRELRWSRSLSTFRRGATIGSTPYCDTDIDIVRCYFDRESAELQRCQSAEPECWTFPSAHNQRRRRAVRAESTSRNASVQRREAPPRPIRNPTMAMTSLFRAHARVRRTQRLRADPTAGTESEGTRFLQAGSAKGSTLQIPAAPRLRQRLCRHRHRSANAHPATLGFPDSAELPARD